MDPILNISSSTRCTAYYNGTTNEVLEMHCMKRTMQLDYISKPTTSLYSDSQDNSSTTSHTHRPVVVEVAQFVC